jgi:hypothetical protein
MLGPENKEGLISSLDLTIGVSKSGSVRFLHKKMNQTDIINFKILKPKPVQTDWFRFGSVRFLLFKNR